MGAFENFVDQQAFTKTQVVASAQSVSHNSVSSINFGKNVNKLVNDVAYAIGESVRRMQPRSLQRSAIRQSENDQSSKRQKSNSSNQK